MRVDAKHSRVAEKYTHENCKNHKKKILKFKTFKKGNKTYFFQDYETWNFQYVCDPTMHKNSLWHFFVVVGKTFEKTFL